MSDQREVLASVLRRALSGHQSHVSTASVFDGLDWKQAGLRPPGSPHSAYEFLFHMVFWQEWVLKCLDGGRPGTPKHASGSWPRALAPSARQAWTRDIRRFKTGLRRLDRSASQGDILRERKGGRGLDMLQAIASHNSYHAGEVVLLRQMLGSWPPPSGGLTW